MTEISITAGTLRKDSVGNLTLVSADATSVGNADTWTVPHLRNVILWGFTCTTDDDSGGTVDNSLFPPVITIANGASIAGKVWALGF